MRNKDDNKRVVIMQAAIKLIHEIGFSEISMAKIAKEANVSPSAIYVYFNDKEDMLNKLFLFGKGLLFEAMLAGHNTSDNVYDSIKQIYYNFYNFMMRVLYKPILSKIFPNIGVSSKDLAEAIFRVAFSESKKVIYENKDIRGADSTLD